MANNNQMNNDQMNQGRQQQQAGGRQQMDPKGQKGSRQDDGQRMQQNGQDLKKNKGGH